MKKVIPLAIMSCVILVLHGCYQPAPKVRSSAAPRAISPVPPVKKKTPPPIEKQVVTQESGGASFEPFTFSAPETEKMVTRASVDELLPSLEYVTSRIDAYRHKLDRWKEIDQQSLLTNLNQETTEQMIGCFRQLQKVLKGYTAIHDWQLRAGYSNGSASKPDRSMQELHKMDIAFLESSCGRMLAEDDNASSGILKKEQQTGLAHLESLLTRYAENKEYEEVIQTWLQIPEEQLDRVSLPAKICYADALMFLHQEEGAAKIYFEIVTQMSSKEQSTDLISLRKKLADLYTASGNYEAAKEQYYKIADDYQAVGAINDWSTLQLSILSRSLDGSPELHAYSELLRNYLGFIPEKDGYKVVWQATQFLKDYPYSAVSSNVDIIKAVSQAKADTWFDTSMQAAEGLGQEKKYQEAVDLLTGIPDDIIDDSRRSEKKTQTDQFVLAEAVERETQKLEDLQELQRKWNSAMLLVKGKRFDEAIDLFTEMFDTEYGPRAEQKITEVSLLAARSERKRAADMFFRYREAGDIESQKKLLIQSRRILKDILVKYPEVEIIAKVNRNIATVEQEMNRLDPHLILIADQGDAVESRTVLDPFEMTSGEEQFFEDTSSIIETPLQ